MLAIYKIWFLLIIIASTKKSAANITNNLEVGDNFQILCGSSIHFSVSFSYLNTIGYENTSSDQLILKSGSSVDCEATKNSTGFVFHLVGSDVYNCAKAYNFSNGNLNLFYNAQMFITSSAVISRSLFAQYYFSCIFTKEQILTFNSRFDTLNNEATQIEAETKLSGGTVIGLATKTDQTLQQDSAQRVFDVGSDIFIATDLFITDHSDIVVQITKCVASFDTVEIVLIQDGCSQLADVVKIIKNYEGSTAGFLLKAFLWDDSSDSDLSFNVQCSVRLCSDSKVQNQCKEKVCSNRRRRRSLTEDKEKLFKVPIGPFTVHKTFRQSCDLDRNGCSHKCHLDNEGNAICSCPDANYILDADKKTCLYDLQADLKVAEKIKILLLLVVVVSTIIILILFVGVLLKKGQKEKLIEKVQSSF